MMVFTKEDKVVIKFLRETKRYGAKRFLSEFPTKLWSLSGLKRLIKKLDDTGSTERATGAGGRAPRDVTTTSNVSSNLLHVSRQKATTLCTSCL